MNLKQLVTRWQEFAGWLPLVGLLALAAWVFLGGLDRSQGAISLSLLIELPVLTAYALAALGLAQLARRRFRKKLTEEQQEQLWQGVLRGDRGALVVFISDTVVWLVLALVLLAFFWPAR